MMHLLKLAGQKSALAALNRSVGGTTHRENIISQTNFEERGDHRTWIPKVG